MLDRLSDVFRVDYHNWWLVAFYLLLAGGFIYGVLRPRTRTEWRSLGLAQAFVVALYAEMYGLPLTMYGVAWLTGKTEFASDHFHGHAWAYLLGWDETGAVVLTFVGNALVALGGLIALLGWRQVHRARGGLVRDGLYRRIRHPQYTGFFLFLIGSLVNWPTLPTLVMFPILLWVYWRLALAEERDVANAFSDDYQRYRRTTGMFLPRRSAKPGPLAQGTVQSPQP